MHKIYSKQKFAKQANDHYLAPSHLTWSDDHHVYQTSPSSQRLAPAVLAPPPAWLDVKYFGNFTSVPQELNGDSFHRYSRPEIDAAIMKQMAPERTQIPAHLWRSHAIPSGTRHFHNLVATYGTDQRAVLRRLARRRGY
jgi:hypothetical protein